jgi:hypothetical protein
MIICPGLVRCERKFQPQHRNVYIFAMVDTYYIYPVDGVVSKKKGKDLR